MAPCPPREQAVEGAGRRAQERRRNADRWRDPDAIAVAGHVLDRDPAVIAGDPGADGPACRRQLVEPWPGDRRATLGPSRDLGGRQVAQPPEQVVDAVDRRRPPVVGQRLDAQLEVGQRVRVE